MSEFSRNAAALIEKAQRNARKILIAGGYAIEGRAVQKAPIKEGHLRGSANVFTEDKFDGFAVYISFGNEVVPYALYQHKHKEFKHPGGGEAEYLKKAFMELKPAIKRSLKGILRG